MRLYLSVPYHEKDLAKSAGALWDRERKQWYAPEEADIERLARWLDCGEGPTATKKAKPRNGKHKPPEVRMTSTGWITGKDYRPTPSDFLPWEDGSEDIFLSALDKRK